MKDKGPVIKKTKPNKKGEGAPVIADEQYALWIEDMRPFLRQGCSLNFAIDKAGITTHRTSIYDKYREKGWFSDRIDTIRSYAGDIINNVGFKVVENIHTRLVETDGKADLSNNEVQVWKTMAEKHRSAQPFFVTRTETSESKREDIGKVLDIIEGEVSDYGKLGSEAERQILETNPPIQDQGQIGEASTIPAEPAPTEAPSGEGSPPIQPAT